METSVVNNTVQNLPQTYIPQQDIYQKSDVQPPGKYWDDRVYDAVRCGSWSKTDVHHRVNLQGWLPYLKQLPRDPYVDSRWKRMSWFYLNQSGEPVVVPDCPMAQAGAFNDADTMADKVRHYAPLEDDFIRRKDVSEFIKGWAGLWLVTANGSCHELLSPTVMRSFHFAVGATLFTSGNARTTSESSIFSVRNLPW